MDIRRATVTDIETIASFNQKMALETEDKILETEVITAGVKRIIEDESLGFYIVHESTQGRPDACLAITYEWSDWRNGLFWWIQSVYVDTSARQAGVFRSLYQHVSELAKQQADVCGIRLYVEKANVNAMATYDKLGMHETEYRLMEEEF